MTQQFCGKFPKYALHGYVYGCCMCIYGYAHLCLRRYFFFQFLSKIIPLFLVLKNFVDVLPKGNYHAFEKKKPFTKISFIPFQFPHDASHFGITVLHVTWKVRIWRSLSIWKVSIGIFQNFFLDSVINDSLHFELHYWLFWH